jgi:hypothetical protein
MSKMQRVSGVARAQVPVRVRDLSMGGAHMVVTAAIQEGSVHEFMLELAGEPFLAMARVVRCQQLASGNGFDLAVEFTSLDSRDEQRLKTYLQRSAHL